MPLLETVTLPQALSISQIKSENATTKTFTLSAGLKAIPGQFVMAWLPGHEDKPFSLANADPIRLTIAAVGPVSQAIHQLRLGDSLWIRGPLGQGFQLPEQPTTPQHLLFIGGGYGVAPLRFLAELALAQGHQVTMVIGARSAANLLMADDFCTLGVNLWLTTEDGSQGITGRVTDAISQILSQTSLKLKPSQVYACGPTGMLTAVSHLCQEGAIPVQLAWEAHMRCGIGLCGSCEVGPGWLTCLDGPMFPFNPLTTYPNPATAGPYE